MQLDETANEFVFEPGALPAPECHAATLLPLEAGGLLCAFFAGTTEGNPDVAIWWSMRSAGAWMEPQPLAQVEPQPQWNPVLFAQDGLAQLYFKSGPSPRRWRTWLQTRPLAGGSWSSPELLVPGDDVGRGPVKNKPIRLQDGSILAPASVETARAWDCFIDRSTDAGRTWQRSALIPFDHPRHGRGIIQPTLWESTPGRVHLLARSKVGRLFRADSEDGGVRWSEARPTALPNNDSGVDLDRLSNGMLVLAYNPVEKRKIRTPLHLAVSEDHGERWVDIMALEDQPGEYSYPAVVSTDRGFAVAYTWNRRSIRVREFAVRAEASDA